jgi:hypothetical protein
MKISSRRHPARLCEDLKRERRDTRYWFRCRTDTTSPGSKSSYHLEVRWRSCLWLVQVRSSRSGVPRWLSRAERQQMLQCCQAKAINAIVALNSKERILSYTARVRA